MMGQSVHCQFAMLANKSFGMHFLDVQLHDMHYFHRCSSSTLHFRHGVPCSAGEIAVAVLLLGSLFINY